MTTTDNQHYDSYGQDLRVNHTICAALAKGKTVQFREDKTLNWEDFTTDNIYDHGLFGPWCYFKHIEWRVKPEIKKYRVGINKQEDLFIVNSDKAMSIAEQMLSFDRWLGEWVEYES